MTTSPNRKTQIAHAEESYERMSVLEKNVAGLASNIDALIKDTKEHRDRVDLDQQRIWNALEKQGNTMQAAFERLNTKGEISWGKIVSTGGFLMLIIGAVASMSNALIEGRIRQVEIKEQSNKELMEARLEIERVRHAK